MILFIARERGGEKGKAFFLPQACRNGNWKGPYHRDLEILCTYRTLVALWLWPCTHPAGTEQVREGSCILCQGSFIHASLVSVFCF